MAIRHARLSTLSLTLALVLSCTSETKRDDEADGGGGAGGTITGSMSVCGDGVVDAGEICDDGNNTSSDGCASCGIEVGYSCSGEPSQCEPICGDGVVTGAEACDDLSGRWA